ncbi:MAG TPA: hypothetical protein VMV86_03440 [Methanosarcinales archaeon]|nr:hypothetical protein [Methanosarcinales archaeon]
MEDRRRIELREYYRGVAVYDDPYYPLDQMLIEIKGEDKEFFITFRGKPQIKGVMSETARWIIVNPSMHMSTIILELDRIIYNATHGIEERKGKQPKWKA